MSVARLAPLVAAFALSVLASSALAGDPPAPPDAAPDPAKLVEALKSKDKPARLQAAQQSKDVQDDKLVAPLAALLDDEDVAVRHAAIDALGRRTAPETQKKASAAIAAHVPKLARKEGEEAEAELIAAVQALGALAQPSALEVLMSDIEVGTAPGVVKARLTAVANVPTADAIDALIQFLAKQGRGRNGPQREACRAALMDATGEKLGNDPDAWRAWWKDAKKTFDFAAAAQRRASEKDAKEDREQHKREKKDKKDDGGEGKK